MRLSIAALPFLFVTVAAHPERDPTDVIATVLGEVITVADATEIGIDSLINGALLTQFAKDNGIEATEEELTAFTDWLAANARESLTEFEAQRVELLAALEAADDASRARIQGRLDTVVSLIEARSEPPPDPALTRPIAKRWVENWKIQKALFDKYGGRAHYQQAGVQPFDAVIEFLQEQEAKGAFTILDDSYEDEFWAYWRSDGHDFIPEEKAAELLATPMWLKTGAND